MIDEKKVNEIFDNYKHIFGVCASAEDVLNDLKIRIRDTQDNTPAKMKLQAELDEFIPVITKAQRDLKLAALEIDRINILSRLSETLN